MANNFRPQWNLMDLTPNNPEYNLFESTIMEFNDIQGFPCQYYIKNSQNFDQLYGEDTLENFLGPFDTKMTYRPNGEINVLNIFGITGDDTIDNIEIPKGTFTRDVSAGYQPIVGDVVRLMWNNKLYEITSMTGENKVFQAQKMIFSFIMRPYRHNEMNDSSFIEGNLDSMTEFPEINDMMMRSGELSGIGDTQVIKSTSKEIEDYEDVDLSWQNYLKP